MENALGGAFGHVAPFFLRNEALLSQTMDQVAAMKIDRYTLSEKTLHCC